MSRVASSIFSDVIVFGITYKTTKFRMSFALFTCFNYYWQYNLFDAALLEEEHVVV